MTPRTAGGIALHGYRASDVMSQFYCAARTSSETNLLLVFALLKEHKREALGGKISPQSVYRHQNDGWSKASAVLGWEITHVQLVHHHLTSMP